MHSGQQNRIPVEPKFDGRGVPGEADNQLGRDPVGKTTVRAVDHPVRFGVLRSLRVAASHVHRLQGKIFFFNCFCFFYQTRHARACFHRGNAYNDRRVLTAICYYNVMIMVKKKNNKQTVKPHGNIFILFS